jgi:hypothetical protein
MEAVSNAEERLRAALEPHMDVEAIEAEGSVLRVHGRLADGATPEAAGRAAGTVGAVWSMVVDGKINGKPASHRFCILAPLYLEVLVSERAPDDREFLVQLLRVVADDERLDPAEVEFAVITAGRGEGGSVTYWPWEKGEILAVPLEDLGARDLRDGRSFDKYDIRAERFGRDWATAERRSAEVKAAPDVDMFAQPL